MASSPDRNPSTHVTRHSRNPIAGRTDIDSAKKSAKRTQAMGEQLVRNKEAASRA